MFFFQHPMVAFVAFAALYSLAINMGKAISTRINALSMTKEQDSKTFEDVLCDAIFILLLCGVLIQHGSRYSRLAPNLLTTDWPQYTAKFEHWTKPNYRGATSEWNAVIWRDGLQQDEAIGVVNLERGECLSGGEKIVCLTLKDIGLPNTYILRYQPTDSNNWIEVDFPLNPYKRMLQMRFWLVMETILTVGISWHFMWRGYRAAPHKELYCLAFLWGVVILATSVYGGYIAGRILYGAGQAERLRYCLLAFYWESLIAVGLTLCLDIQYYAPGATWHTVRKSLE